MTSDPDGDDRFVAPPRWVGPSADPADEQFGDVVESTTLAATDHDAVLVGEPYDGAVIGRRGAADAPAAIREELAALKTRRLAGSTPPTLGDLGDVVVPDGDVAAVQRGLAETTRAVHALDALPVFLGGDNSLTVANVTPLLDRDVGVVNLDAHLDVRRVRDGPTSGTPYRQLHDAGLAGYVCLGARHFETAGPYVDTLDEWGWQAVPAEAVGGAGVESAVDRALDALSAVETLYVSVDCDVLDAAAAPGVSAPTPGGLSTRELFGIVRRLCADPRLRGVEVVECAPPLDAGGRTVAAAARVVAHALAGTAVDADTGVGSAEVTG
jgi:formiminoglutamase/agmatinase